MRSSVHVPAAVEALLGHPVAALSERPAPRLMVNVTVKQSLWPAHVLLAADATVADLAHATVTAYYAEERRPPLPADDGYDLDALDPEEKVLDLGSRNFFLCSNRGAQRSDHPLLLESSVPCLDV